MNIDDTIDAGMAHRVERAVEEAHSNGASVLLVVLKTNGGVVDDANNIRDALNRYPEIVKVAFVAERAWSAGALIALACDKIVMAPGSSMGAAEPIPSTPKTISALRAEMTSLAEQHHRNADIAAGMSDPDVVIPGLKAKGTILSLSPKVAQRYRFIDAVAPNNEAALAAVGMAADELRVSEPTLGERIAQFVNDPIVSGLLLTLGFLGLLIELQTRYAIAGILGVLALALFFGAHLIAGASTGAILALFGLGVLGLLFELHVLPGHGISGLIGGLLMLASVVLAFGSAFWVVGVEATAIALIAAVAIFAYLLRWLPQSTLMRRLAFVGAQSSGQGYVASPALTFLTGREGVAESMLRPAGVAIIDGTRYQVQTSGDFIPPASRINVERVEGSKIFVKRA